MGRVTCRSFSLCKAAQGKWAAGVPHPAGMSRLLTLPAVGTWSSGTSRLLVSGVREDSCPPRGWCDSETPPGSYGEGPRVLGYGGSQARWTLDSKTGPSNATLLLWVLVSASGSEMCSSCFSLSLLFCGSRQRNLSSNLRNKSGGRNPREVFMC